MYGDDRHFYLTKINRSCTVYHGTTVRDSSLIMGAVDFEGKVVSCCYTGEETYHPRGNNPHLFYSLLSGREGILT